MVAAIAVPLPASAELAGPTDEIAVRGDKTLAEFDTWVNDTDGHMVGDGYCVALFEAYAGFLDLATVPGNPVQFMDNAPETEWIHLSSTISPRKGDVAVYNYYSGGAGHVAMVLADTGSTLRVFQQNWPDGSAAHKQDGMTKDHLIGYLRPRNLH
jgi:hypothetical protein